MSIQRFFLGCLLVAAVSAVRAEDLPEPLFPLQETGVFPIDFSQHGTFSGAGTHHYRYKIEKRATLINELGAGLYPNTDTLLLDPAYLRWKAAHPKAMNPWDHVSSGDPQTDFYVWATASNPGPGTRLLFAGKALAEAGHVKQALKAFHAVLVMYPREACWSEDQSFVWYVADEALSQIDQLVSRYPSLGVEFQNGYFKVTNGNDTTLSNDRFVIRPGRFVKPEPFKPVDLKTLKKVERRGQGDVQLVRYENNHWQLLVEGKPFVVKGITYSPVPVGQELSSYGNQWMFEDKDGNGRVDAAYDTWLDKNGNHQQDEDEENVGDFSLLKDMGVNAIRLYRHHSEPRYDSSEFNKRLLRDLHKNHGIYVILGDFLGAYTIGSGATWEEGTDYTSKEQLQNMRRSLLDYVRDHKDEPYVLMWLLGNENLLPADYTGVNASRTNASVQMTAYMTFVNEMAEAIRKLDPHHPVAVGNVDLSGLEEYARYAPAVDIFGVNSYRGSNGFGNVWRRVQETYNRPVLVTEYGCDAWNSRKNEEDQRMQSVYHEAAWRDIDLHRAGKASEGNSIGGVVFEWSDEWWKSRNDSDRDHSTTADHAKPFPDGSVSEEWFGVVGLGDGADPLMRQPRQVYSLYKRLWSE